MALIGVAVVWGVTFSVVDDSVIDSSVVGGATGMMPPADLVAWRFALGTLLLLLLRTAVGRSGKTPRMPTALRRRGVVLGGFLGAGFLLQTWAMTFTDAVMSAFLTGLLVVIAPVAGWLMFRDRPASVTWIAVTVATAGLAVLSLRGGGFGPGELITLLAAAMWAIHLVLLARWAKPEHAIGLAGIQTATVSALAVITIGVAAVITGRSPLPTLPADGSGWLSVAFLAALATAGAMALLSWAQSRMSAARAAVILTLEPAVAGVTAACLGSEFGMRTIAGGLLLVTAMYLVELGARRRPAHAVPAAYLAELTGWRRRPRTPGHAVAGLTDSGLTVPAGHAASAASANRS